jgi:hypothetical protein
VVEVDQRADPVGAQHHGEVRGGLERREGHAESDPRPEDRRRMPLRSSATNPAW